jgi:predicted TIM-barrel fold metal-dependent hydrolase
VRATRHPDIAMRPWFFSAFVLLLFLAGAVSAAPRDAADAAPSARLGPSVDHHQHLLSPAVADMLGGGQAPVQLPAEIAAVLQRRTAAWNDPQALAPLYIEQALLSDDEVVTGRKAVSEHVASRFGRPYAITPTAYLELASTRQVAAVYSRGEAGSRTDLGTTLLTLVASADGQWRIASETMRFPAPGGYTPIDGDRLVAMLDEASIQRAVVLSIAYLFDSPYRPGIADPAARVRAENDWTAAQVRRHPDRLVGFCSVNPLSESAIAEIDRCARQLHLAGLKLHFGNSQVDVADPDHLAKVQRVFAHANRLRLPLVVHLWTGDDYGRREARIFLDSLLPHAPDVVVQLAHLGGAGPGWTDEALEVFATALEAGDARTRNLYLDVATVAELQKHEQLQRKLPRSADTP